MSLSSSLSSSIQGSPVITETMSLSSSLSSSIQGSPVITETMLLDYQVFTYLSSNIVITEPMGLSGKILSVGYMFNIRLEWDPDDYPTLFTGVNYTYYGAVLSWDGEWSAVEDYFTIKIYFDNTLLITKDTNEYGEFVYWAIVNNAGTHYWSFDISYNGEWLATVFYEPLNYTKTGGGGPFPPSGGGWIPTPPTDFETYLNGVIAYLPAIIVIAIFMFFGSLLAGTIGIVGGLIAGIFVDVSIAFLPQYILFFIILVGVLIGIYKLKQGNGGKSA